MGANTPEETVRIIQILLRGYQFSDADLFKPDYDRWYNILDRHFDWFREHPVEDDFKILKWNDEALDGKGTVDWYPFEHPDLGPVELGGWDTFVTWRNPPYHLLEKEVARYKHVFGITEQQDLGVLV